MIIEKRKIVENAGDIRNAFISISPKTIKDNKIPNSIVRDITRIYRMLLDKMTFINDLK
jgi:hypothetical protein